MRSPFRSVFDFRSALAWLRRPKFTIAGLLILASVSAIVIHWVAIPAYERRLRRQTMQHIDAIGGRWAPVDEHSKRLLLRGADVDDDALDGVAKGSYLMPELVQLDLSETPVTDAAFRSLLRRSIHLRRMVVFRTQISPEGFAEAADHYPQVKIEHRRPDPVATGLANTSVPPAAVISLMVDHAGGAAVFGSGDGRVHRIALDGESDRSERAVHDSWVFGLDLHPSGRWIASGGGDNQVCILDADDLTVRTSATGHPMDVHGVVWLDADTLISVSDDHSIRLWRFDDTGIKPQLHAGHRLENAHEKAIPRVKRIDAQSFLTTSRDHRIGEFRIDDGQILKVQQYDGHTDDCMDVCTAPGGDRFASVGYDGTLRVWKRGRDAPVHTWQISKQRLFCLQVDWTQNLAIVGGMRGVFAADLISGRIKHRRTDQMMISQVVGFGNTVLTSDGMGAIVRRNLRTLVPTSELQIFDASLTTYSDARFRNVRR